MRALLLRLQQWVANGAEPPSSRYPTVSKGTLVPLATYRFSDTPGVEVPKIIHTPHRLDFASEPPKLLAPYVPLVPQADKDGNALGGIRMPEFNCAIGAFTGWNLRHPRIGAPKYLLGNTGSYIPFPRPTILERYPDEPSYTGCVERSANEMVANGLLLPEDVAAIVKQAARHWQWRMTRSETTATSQPIAE